jgi:ABC-type multidrug transport system fused ATPase/permease subunit
VLSVLQAEPSAQTGAVRDAQGPLVFEKFTLGPVRDLDLELPATGLITVICEPETTDALTSVLARKAIPDAGNVRVGGVDLFDLDSDISQQLVRTVPHAPDLFEGTVLDNIGAGAGDLPDRDSRVTTAIFAAACDDVAEVLPLGLDTPVGEAGRMLSGGQRQRVSLARALAADSAVLVLNDPTTAVDSVTEATVAQRLAQARAGRTTVIFTNSPALLEVSDQVIVFDGATVTYQGDLAGAQMAQANSNGGTR